MHDSHCPFPWACVPGWPGPKVTPKGRTGYRAEGAGCLAPEEHHPNVVSFEEPDYLVLADADTQLIVRITLEVFDLPLEGGVQRRAANMLTVLDKANTGPQSQNDKDDLVTFREAHGDRRRLLGIMMPLKLSTVAISDCTSLRLLFALWSVNELYKRNIKKKAPPGWSIEVSRDPAPP